MTRDRSEEEDLILQLRISLRGARPPIWRRVLVPADFTLDGLHAVIQAVMPWCDYHLHEFRIGLDRYGLPDPETGDMLQDETGMTLTQAFNAEGRRISYVYDLGDGWQHEVHLERLVSPSENTEHPLCMGGRNACPPEDSGSLGGYYRKLKILADRAHVEYDDIAEWMGADWDPKRFSCAEANRRLREAADEGLW